MLIIGHSDVCDILRGQEKAVIDLVRDAYARHDEGQSTVPHSVFLRFPDMPRNRIIGLPAYLGGEGTAAGMKWVASFPGNLERGLPRASAAIIMNSLETGRPQALIEGSQISAQRTAASAALAASVLSGGSEGVTLVGCGVIGHEILRYVRAALPDLSQVTLYDSDPDRARAFGARLDGIAVSVAPDLASAMGAHDLVALATTAAEPHMGLEDCRPGAVILHISLRDLRPEAILASHNVVDDADHVCRERTSLHLTEQRTGGRDFIDAPIGALVRGTATLRRDDPTRPVVYSPFGLGVLDIALAEHVRTTALARGLGLTVDGFLGD